MKTLFIDIKHTNIVSKFFNYSYRITPIIIALTGLFSVFYGLLRFTILKSVLYPIVIIAGVVVIVFLINRVFKSPLLLQLKTWVIKYRLFFVSICMLILGFLVCFLLYHYKVIYVCNENIEKSTLEEQDTKGIRGDSLSTAIVDTLNTHKDTLQETANVDTSDIDIIDDPVIIPDLEGGTIKYPISKRPSKLKLGMHKYICLGVVENGEWKNPKFSEYPVGQKFDPHDILKEFIGSKTNNTTLYDKADPSSRDWYVSYPICLRAVSNKVIEQPSGEGFQIWMEMEIMD